MNRIVPHTRPKFLMILFSAALVLLIGGCIPVTRASWEVFELLSKDNEEMRTVSESIRVSGCVIPERKSVDCSAGTDNELTFVLGGSVGGGGRGTEINVSPGVEASLIVGQSDGESLELPQAEPGFIYHYEVLKTYRVISGEVLARSSMGQTRTASFAFHASCSVQAASVQIEPCAADAAAPTVAQQPTFAIPETTSETPLPIPPAEYPVSTPIPQDDSKLIALQYQLTNCTFVYGSNQMSQTLSCPSTVSNRPKNIFLHAVLINTHLDTLHLSGVTAVLTRADGRSQPINNPIYTTLVKFEPGEKLPLIISVLPQLLELNQDYQLHITACLQDEPCLDTAWQDITGEPYYFNMASR